MHGVPKTEGLRKIGLQGEIAFAEKLMPKRLDTDVSQIAK
jgi:hypothetical protein